MSDTNAPEAPRPGVVPAEGSDRRVVDPASAEGRDLAAAMRGADPMADADADRTSVADDVIATAARPDRGLHPLKWLGQQARKLGERSGISQLAQDVRDTRADRQDPTRVERRAEEIAAQREQRLQEERAEQDRFVREVVGFVDISREPLSDVQRERVTEAQRVLFDSIDPSKYTPDPAKYTVDEVDYQDMPKRERERAVQARRAELAAQMAEDKREMVGQVSREYRVVADGDTVYFVHGDPRGVDIGPDGAFTLRNYTVQESETIPVYNDETEQYEQVVRETDVRHTGSVDISRVSFSTQPLIDRGVQRGSYDTAALMLAGADGRLARDETAVHSTEVRDVLTRAAQRPITLELDSMHGMTVVHMGTETPAQRRQTEIRVLDTRAAMLRGNFPEGMIVVGAGADSYAESGLQIAGVSDERQWLGPQGREGQAAERPISVALDAGQRENFNLLTAAQQQALLSRLDGVPSGYDFDARGFSMADPGTEGAVTIPDSRDIRRTLQSQAESNLRLVRGILEAGDDVAVRAAIDASTGSQDVLRTALVIAARRGQEGYGDPDDAMAAANAELAEVMARYNEGVGEGDSRASRLDQARDILADRFGIDRTDSGSLANSYAERLAESIGERNTAQSITHFLSREWPTGADGARLPRDEVRAEVVQAISALGLEPSDAEAMFDSRYPEPGAAPADRDAAVLQMGRDIRSENVTSLGPSEYDQRRRERLADINEGNYDDDTRQELIAELDALMPEKQRLQPDNVVARAFGEFNPGQSDTEATQSQIRLDAEIEAMDVDDATKADLRAKVALARSRMRDDVLARASESEARARALPLRERVPSMSEVAARAALVEEMGITDLAEQDAYLLTRNSEYRDRVTAAATVNAGTADAT